MAFAVRNSEEISIVGLVTVRQRSGTAAGVVFITLEDETGQINVVVWSSLVEPQRREVLGRGCSASSAPCSASMTRCT